jgi:4-hydroxy-tetrahydrodipicolinate synthase
MSSEKNMFRGAWTALVTPFTKDGSAVDYDSLGRLIEFQIQSGISGLVACGSTGEAATLEDAEYDMVVRRTAEISRGRVPVIAGVGSSSTARARAMAERVASAKVDGILVVTPPYIKPPQDGIMQHVRSAQGASNLPVVLYNIPGRSGVNIAPTTVAKLFRDGVIAAIKESSGSIDQVTEILALTEGQLPVLAGEDSQVLAVMASGGTGTISASANIAPKQFARLCQEVLDLRLPAARSTQFELLPLIRLMFTETNPIPVKAALAERGVIAHPTVRLPLIEVSPALLERLRQLLNHS